VKGKANKNKTHKPF